MNLDVKTITHIKVANFKQILLFSMVGFSNTFVDFMAFSLFYNFIGIDYAISQVVGYGLGTINSFIFNKRWTFHDINNDKKITCEAFRFIFINIISISISLILIKLFVDKFNFNVYFSKVIITFTIQITNYLGYKLWVFGPEGGTNENLDLE